jgi:DNA polymerase elongation subunit (family B)
MRVPDTKQLDEQGQAAGAYVLVPQTGMQEWIVCFDFSSLYPTCARLLNVSPETIQGQFVDNGDAWRCFDENSDNELTFRWERDGSVETKLMTEWKSLFIGNKWSISSYGTVFDQSNHGIIPALLSGWYAQRKVFQKLKSDTEVHKYSLEQELATLLAQT